MAIMKLCRFTHLQELLLFALLFGLILLQIFDRAATSSGGWRILSFFYSEPVHNRGCRILARSVRKGGGSPTLRFGNPSGCPILRFFPAKGGKAQTSTRHRFYNPSVMPNRLVRYQKCGCFHFFTFSCYRRLPLLNSAAAYGVFENVLESVRLRYGFVVADYVLMPEHVHLLVGEPARVTTNFSQLGRAFSDLGDSLIAAGSAARNWFMPTEKESPMDPFNVH